MQSIELDACVYNAWAVVIDGEYTFGDYDGWQGGGRMTVGE